MNRVAVSTDVYLTAEDVYEFLLDFRGYASYSAYLRTVRQFGDGGVGTEYELEFAWWKLQYTARSKVTELDPPNRIEWELTKDIDATGRWLVEPAESIEPSEGGGDEDDLETEPKTEVTIVVEYAPVSANEGAIDLPRFVSLGWVVEKVKPKIRAEAERIVRRVVADLEGEARDVDLRIETS